MWSGFSSEIETPTKCSQSTAHCSVACGAASHLRLKHEHVHVGKLPTDVACGAASHLRLKQLIDVWEGQCHVSRMWSGFSSEIETVSRLWTGWARRGRMWSGFSSEIETPNVGGDRDGPSMSHVERLLI